MLENHDIFSSCFSEDASEIELKHCEILTDSVKSSQEYLMHLKDECPVNALRAQTLAGGHFLGREIRLLFVSLSI